MSTSKCLEENFLRGQLFEVQGTGDDLWIKDKKARKNTLRMPAKYEAHLEMPSPRAGGSR